MKNIPFLLGNILCWIFFFLVGVVQRMISNVPQHFVTGLKTRIYNAENVTDTQIA